MANYNITAKTNTEKFTEIIDQLPEFTHRYFYSGMSEKAMLTKLSYARDLKYFFDYAVRECPYFSQKAAKDLDIEDIRKLQADDINDFITWMRENQKLSDRTCARRKSSLSGLYEYLINSVRRLEYNPVSGATQIILPSDGNVTYLNLKEQEKLLDYIRNGNDFTGRQQTLHEKYRKRDLAIFFLFLDTGLRISELQALNADHVMIYEDPVDEEKNECYVIVMRKGKNKSEATTKIYFADECKDYISDYLESRKALGEEFSTETPLFTTATGERLSVREIQYLIKKYVKEALNRDDISVNTLRSSFAMEFYKHERNILVLQERLGHATVNATNVYAKASEKEESVKKSRNWRRK